MTCVLSFLFSGSRLYREPLDLYIQKNAAPDVSEPRLGVKKGFTRLNLDEIIPCLVQPTGNHQSYFITGNETLDFT